MQVLLLIFLPWLIGALLVYAGVCRAQRYKQCRSIEADYHRRRGSSLSSMDFGDAWKIQKWLAEQEFPKTLSTGVFFALFKVRDACASTYNRTMLIGVDLWHSFDLHAAYIHWPHD